VQGANGGLLELKKREIHSRKVFTKKPKRSTSALHSLGMGGKKHREKTINSWEKGFKA